MAHVPVIDIGEAETLDPAKPGQRARKLWSMVLLLAIKDMATVIHFEPHRGKRSLIYRVNGLYHDLMSPPKEMADELIGEIENIIDPGRLGHRARGLLGWLERRRKPSTNTVPKALVELTIEDQFVHAIVTVPPTKYGKSVVIFVVDGTEAVGAQSKASSKATEVFKRMFGARKKNGGEQQRS